MTAHEYDFVYMLHGRIWSPALQFKECTKHRGSGSSFPGVVPFLWRISDRSFDVSFNYTMYDNNHLFAMRAFLISTVMTLLTVQR